MTMTDSRSQPFDGQATSRDYVRIHRRPDAPEVATESSTAAIPTYGATGSAWFQTSNKGDFDSIAGGSRSGELVVPPEPGELRRQIAEELAEGAHDSGSFEVFGDPVAALLWKVWEPVLAAGGIGWESYLDVVAGYRREVRLWAVGERVWEHMVSGLAGRLIRRREAAPERGAGLAGDSPASDTRPAGGRVGRPRDLTRSEVHITVSGNQDGTRMVSHLDELESHAIFVMREVAAESERPALLFSGGKDSAVLLRLAEKAFRPGRLPFPVVHIDTGHNFREAIEFRDRRIAELGEDLIVGLVQETIDAGKVADPGPGESRNRLQSVTLLDVIAENGFDAAIGGARRDEDKARAKERVLSFRDRFGQWDPRNQRPELWQLYQGKVRPGEHLRAFPLSDWTELDIWQYIERESMELPSIYFAHERDVIDRNGILLAVSEWVQPRAGETVLHETVRFRTVGDATCTGAVRSSASTVHEVITEVAASRITERGATRADDKFSESSMEDRKREGYF